MNIPEYIDIYMHVLKLEYGQEIITNLKSTLILNQPIPYFGAEGEKILAVVIGI